MAEHIQRIAPTNPGVAEFFINHQLSHEFHREINSRQAHQKYCQWYRLTAQQHQQEQEKMRGDINILGWFLRRRKRARASSNP